jgi:hypothetical protein
MQYIPLPLRGKAIKGSSAVGYGLLRTSSRHIVSLAGSRRLRPAGN